MYWVISLLENTPNSSVRYSVLTLSCPSCLSSLYTSSSLVLFFTHTRTYAHTLTGGMSVGLEHRFYGKSVPNNDTSLSNLRYLTSTQALADAAAFRAYFANKYNTLNSKWIIVGGSYSGCLSAWLRHVWDLLSFVVSLVTICVYVHVMCMRVCVYMCCVFVRLPGVWAYLHILFYVCCCVCVCVFVVCY